ELWVGDEDREDADQPLADVFGREADAARREVVGLDVVADGLGQPGPQAVLVRPARRGGNAVDVAAHVLLGRLGPLQDHLDPRAVVPAQRERLIVYGRRPALGGDFPEVIDDAFIVLERPRGPADAVVEGDLQPLVDEAGDL